MEILDEDASNITGNSCLTNIQPEDWTHICLDMTSSRLKANLQSRSKTERSYVSQC